VGSDTGGPLPAVVVRTHADILDVRAATLRLRAFAAAYARTHTSHGGHRLLAFATARALRFARTRRSRRFGALCRNRTLSDPTSRTACHSICWCCWFACGRDVVLRLLCLFGCSDTYRVTGCGALRPLVQYLCHLFAGWFFAWVILDSSGCCALRHYRRRCGVVTVLPLRHYRTHAFPHAFAVAAPRGAWRRPQHRAMP